MLYRPLGANGDMIPVTWKDQIWNSAKAVATAIESRLHFFTGEWWEDESLGFGLMALLADGNPTSSQTDAIARIITRYIQDTQNVAQVVDVKASYDRATRCVNYRSRAITTEGNTIRLEVKENGVSATVLG